MALIQFGSFRLDPENGVLFRGAEPVNVGRRAVAVLQTLLERPGELISKDALIDTAWSGRAVEEGNLTVQITALRRVLGEEPGGAKWIQTLPGRGYRFVGPIDTATEHPVPGVREAGDAPILALPDRPSIAVLPFQNLSGDPDQDYFADGIVEEIITALSRAHWLFVIARNSSFTYKGRVIDAKQVGRELGVRYVLEGSVRKQANRVRITTQLIDTSTAANLWADHFEAELDDIFALQDQVTRSIVGAIAPKLEQAEIEYGNRKQTESLTAFDYYLRGRAYLYRATQSGSSQALQLFKKALEVDPQFASAYGMASLCYIQRKYFGWMSDPVEEMAEAARLARRAITLGRDDPVSLCAGGFTLAQSPGRLEAGAALIDRALALDSNQAVAWFLKGWVLLHLGQPEAAIESFSRALRLNPLDPLIFTLQTGMGAAHFLAGRYDEASSWAEMAAWERMTFPAPLRIAAASHALAGQLAEAQRAIARLRELDPEFRVADVEAVAPFRQPEAVARYINGLRKAGLPE